MFLQIIVQFGRKMRNLKQNQYWSASCSLSEVFWKKSFSCSSWMLYNISQLNNRKGNISLKMCISYSSLLQRCDLKCRHGKRENKQTNLLSRVIFALRIKDPSISAATCDSELISIEKCPNQRLSPARWSAHPIISSHCSGNLLIKWSSLGKQTNE